MSRRMTLHWIDHVTIPTNDMNAISKWAVAALGAQPGSYYGVSTAERQKNVPVHVFMALHEDHGIDEESGLQPNHFGAFLLPEMLPKETAPLGKATPRYGFYIRREDIDAHMKRLERIDHAARNPTGINTNKHGVGIPRCLPYSDPVRTSIGGEDGTVIRFTDPDDGQWEFWAPDRMPHGAMSDPTPLGVGRISTATYGSRNLRKTAEFFSRFCGIEPAETGSDFDRRLVMPLAGGPHIVYELTAEPDVRTKDGTGIGLHAALTVEADDLIPLYERMWEAIPEWDGPGENGVEPPPVRTEMHGSLVGRRWKKMLGRGDYFSDGEGHVFHFHGAINRRSEGSLVLYDNKNDEDYLVELSKAKGLEIPDPAVVA